MLVIPLPFSFYGIGLAVRQEQLHNITLTHMTLARFVLRQELLRLD
jgi:hypothetical protein